MWSGRADTLIELPYLPVKEQEELLGGFLARQTAENGLGCHGGPRKSSLGHQHWLLGWNVLPRKDR